MIREIGRELETQLHAAGVPISVVDGPEASATTTWGRERIVIEYDLDASDAFGPPRRVHTNPKHRYTATEACKLTIYAEAAGPGASVFEHRRRAKHFRDAVLVALEYVAAVRKDRFAPTSGKLVTPPDLAGADKPGGAVYELKFTFDRGIASVTWAGAKNPEATIGSIATTDVKVSSAGQSGAAEDIPVNVIGH